MTATSETATESDDHKIFVSRIPKSFDESTVKRLLEENLGEGAVISVSLLLQNETDDNANDDPKTGGSDGRVKAEISNSNSNKDHRGFSFVVLKNSELYHRALELGTVRGGVKETSKKKCTIYMAPVVRGVDDECEGKSKQICFLWSKFRCPYQDNCKFHHTGPGGCTPIKTLESPKRPKCFAFRKGKKCKLGDQCPFSHDMTIVPREELRENLPPEEKDCINWKTKGKCRKGDKCPYRHDQEVLNAFLSKASKSRDNVTLTIKEKKAMRGDEKKNQTLSVRVFGLNYDTTEIDVRDFFQHCGPITELTFPTFDDSGRSKGYCGLVFQSPKAVAAAQELDGQELQGRWLQIQAGKMYLQQWEKYSKESTSKDEKHTRQLSSENLTTSGSPKRQNFQSSSIPFSDMDTGTTQIGEFGQKVKRRKTHGHKE
jgi:RNA recognition motif-containing protein